MRLSYIRGLIAALVMAAAPAWAGITTSGFFFSDAPGTATLTPGQVFTVTITASSSAVPPVMQLSTLTLTDPSGQFQIVGGTCAVGTAYSTGTTCTVQIRFNGTATGTFNGTLTGSCSGTAAVGGYSINCGLTGAGPVATLAQVTGSAVAAAIDSAIDTLGSGGLSLLIFAVLVIGAYRTLRQRAS